MYPKKGGDLIKVIHRVNQKIVVTECESVRGSNVAGYIDLLRVKKVVSRACLKRRKLKKDRIPLPPNTKRNCHLLSREER